MIELNVGLFGKPAWELGLEKELDITFVNELSEKGDELCLRLKESADTIGKLMNNGWSAYGTLYDVIMSKDVSVNDAEEELKNLGLDKYIECLEEFEEELDE